MRRLLFENYEIPAGETEDGRILVIVDIDLNISDLSTGPRLPDTGDHVGGAIFIEQQFLVDRPTLDMLLGMNKFYTNLSDEKCIIDILSEIAPVAGESSGMQRKTRPDRFDTPAGAYRFVAP